MLKNKLEKLFDFLLCCFVSAEYKAYKGLIVKVALGYCRGLLV